MHRTLKEFITHIKTIGLPTSSKFSVILPNMVDSNNTETVQMLCDGIALPGSNIMTRDVRIFGEATEMPYGITYPTIMLSFIEDANNSVRKYWHNWMEMVFNKTTRTLGYYNNYAKPIDFETFDRIGTSIFNMKLQEAYPKSIDTVQMQSGNNSIVKLNVTIIYKWHEINNGSRDPYLPTVDNSNSWDNGTATEFKASSAISRYNGATDNLSTVTSSSFGSGAGSISAFDNKSSFSGGGSINRTSPKDTSSLYKPEGLGDTTGITPLSIDSSQTNNSSSAMSSSINNVFGDKSIGVINTGPIIERLVGTTTNYTGRYSNVMSNVKDAMTNEFTQVVTGAQALISASSTNMITLTNNYITDSVTPVSNNMGDQIVATLDIIKSSNNAISIVIGDIGTVPVAETITGLVDPINGLYSACSNLNVILNEVGIVNEFDQAAAGFYNVADNLNGNSELLNLAPNLITLGTTYQFTGSEFGDTASLIVDVNGNGISTVKQAFTNLSNVFYRQSNNIFTASTASQTFYTVGDTFISESMTTLPYVI